MIHEEAYIKHTCAITFTSHDIRDLLVLQPFDRRISHQSTQMIVNGRRGIMDPE